MIFAAPLLQLLRQLGNWSNKGGPLRRILYFLVALMGIINLNIRIINRIIFVISETRVTVLSEELSFLFINLGFSNCKNGFLAEEKKLRTNTLH
jgi:hypothetical protein